MWDWWNKVVNQSNNDSFIGGSTMFVNKLKSKKGAAMVEYGLLVAGVTLVAVAALAVFGHKTSDLYAASAAILPGAHAGDNGPITSGKLIETTEADGAGTPIALDTAAIATAENTARLGDNLGTDLTALVVEP
jgi:Flp pilus assembly pilin Flp